jgi:hypothetical protein
VYTVRRAQGLLVRRWTAIRVRGYQWAAAAAGVLALTAAFTRIWLLAAAAAGIAGAVALFSRPSEGDENGASTGPPHKYEPAIQPPTTAEAEDVVYALFRAATRRLNAVAAHLWLQDPATATLRLVAAKGDKVPSSTPISLDHPSLSSVVDGGGTSLEPVVALTGPASSTTLWRYAFPIAGRPAAGVGCIDIETAVRPDLPSLDSIARAFQPSLSTALALHVARSETLEAVNLIEAAHELSRRLSPAEVVAIALERSMALSSAASGSVMLVDDDGRTLRIALSQGLPDEVVADTLVESGEGIAGWVFASGKPLLVEDLPNRASSRRRPYRG